MIYFVTGITGTVVPVVIEELMKKEADARFYFAIRSDSKGNGIQQRFERVIDSMDLEHNLKRNLMDASRLVEIDIEKEKMGIDPDIYTELVECTGKILHGAADVRFDQPYEKIRIPNVVFTRKIYELFDAIKAHRQNNGQPDPTLYYISTGYAYGIYKKPIPEDFPAFHPGEPDNTYATTKAEAKRFILEKIGAHNDRIVIFEPTIIGGSARTGRTRTYNLHYIVMMLGYMGKLPFLTAADNTLDIVPVDWVARVVAAIMDGDRYHQGVVRLAAGKNAVPIGYLHHVGYNYYVNHDPVEGRVIPRIRFVPRWFFYSMINAQKTAYKVLYTVTRNRRFKKLVKGISLLEGYFPYITGYKVFENEKSNAVIEKYTDCGPAPILQDIADGSGNLVAKGYFDKILADTLKTGWGGMIDFERLQKKTTVYEEPRPVLQSHK